MPLAIYNLPFPPSVNAYYRHVMMRGRPATLISAKGREYREDVLACVIEAGIPPRLACRLEVSIELHPPDRRKRDLDNCLKALFDALTHASVWLDDSQIDELRVSRTSQIDGTVTIVVEEAK